MKPKLLISILATFLLALPTINADLIAHYLCDETSGTNIDDIMNNYEGTVSSASMWNAGGKINGACYPDDLYYVNDINFGTINNWTITFWWKPDTTYGPSNWNYMISDVGAYGAAGTGSNTGIEVMNTAGAQATHTVPNMGAGVWHHVIVTETSGNVNVYLNNTASVSNPSDKYHGISGLTGLLNYQKDSLHEAIPDGMVDDIRIYSEVITSANRSFIFNSGAGTQDNYSTPDLTPPELSLYNMTSGGGVGCINWRTDKSNPCSTSDTTPTVTFATNENANCAIGISDSNYTNMTTSRICDGGEGTTEHTCTLTAQDQLKTEDSAVYIGCKNTNGAENQNSSSGALKLSVQSSSLETRGRYGIETGIQHALGSGYTIYTDQRIYARNSANQQSVGVFDKVVKWMSKIWAFNFLTGNDTSVNMFNITPVLYYLELKNNTNSTVNATVYQLIMDTK